MAGDRRFRTTRWSVVLAARDGDAPESHDALSGLCEAYWYPLYAFIRRQGYGTDEARDLTQSYFLTLLEKEYLKDVQPAAGKFRSFLLVSLKHFLSHERDRARALKRGGGTVVVSIDTDRAERLFRDEPVERMSPDRMFERRWALTVLERARAGLREQFEQVGKLRQFELLKGYLTGESDRRPYGDVAAELEMSEGAIRIAVLRMRRRYGELLRAEIEDTMAEGGDVAAEVRYLLSVVGD